MTAQPLFTALLASCLALPAGYPLSAEAPRGSTGPVSRGGLAREPLPDAAAPPFILTPSTHPIRAIHLTCWNAGSPKYRRWLDNVLNETVINAVVIDVKEFHGEVYLPGAASAKQAGAYVNAVPDLAEWLAELKKRGVYTIARQVVFKDNIMPRKNPSLGVHNHLGELWYDHGHTTWLDPYNKDAWRYNLLIALQASKLGFDEVQFDYIRFPTDGHLQSIRYSVPHNRQAASQALVDFLGQARQLLHPLGTKISIDVFGLTTSDNSGMGIGQRIVPMTEKVDYVCPMVYPSHYYRGEYGLPEPNREPYKTVYYGLKDAVRGLGPLAQKLRPYLQDFSLGGVRYGPEEVRAQIQAAADVGIQDWSLWNAGGSYTLQALKTAATPGPKPYVIQISTP
ncbi:MAG: hypothetical protein A2992_02215 [Elusimicrobia bacterium RIFCSPLOWO2_01_FULL_59_12]|nr:MAG: hypothetical protein A2992_02215 [Elusimicrobia bacterium RIFCSPLOWO2_01_FULL_59_12]